MKCLPFFHKWRVIAKVPKWNKRSITMFLCDKCDSRRIKFQELNKYDDQFPDHIFEKWSISWIQYGRIWDGSDVDMIIFDKKYASKTIVSKDLMNFLLADPIIGDLIENDPNVKADFKKLRHTLKMIS